VNDHPFAPPAAGVPGRSAPPSLARDLASAAILGSRLTADSGIPGHDAFHAKLKAKHGRKYGFWQIVEAGPRGAHR